MTGRMRQALVRVPMQCNFVLFAQIIFIIIIFQSFSFFLTKLASRFN
jgi:hypothetical protein